MRNDDGLGFFFFVGFLIGFIFSTVVFFDSFSMEAEALKECKENIEWCKKEKPNYYKIMKEYGHIE